MVHIGNQWDEVLADEFQQPYYQKLRQFLKEEYRTHTIYPGMHDIFNALKYTDYPAVKVVLLGQDPYHGAGQAHGLSFSVQKGIAKPPSLRNIFKELQEDVGVVPPSHGCLESWAKNGVLLLNTVLTVQEGKANSHKGKGWETLTDHIIQKLNERQQPIVFMLWGANAKSKQALLDNPNHLVLTATHPSPLAAKYGGFFGCRHFSKANEFLQAHGVQPVDWNIPE